MLNKKLLAYKTRSLIKKSQTVRRSVSYAQAKNVGIIFSIDDLKKHDAIKKLIKQLEQDGKEVHTLAYLPNGHQNFEFMFDFFTSEDVTFWGNFTARQVHDFTERSFDYLFYPDEISNPLIRTILAMSNARCRIGKYDELNSQFCELMIRMQNDSIRELVDNMYKYTKILS